MKSTKTILLTGGTGFLGSNLLRKLLPQYDVIVLVRPSSDTHRINDLSNNIRLIDITKFSLEQIFYQEEIDTVIHCATEYGRKEKNALAIMEANVIFPLKLLELGSKQTLRCFINTDTVLNKNINYYALTKNQFKDWLKVYSNKMVCINVALEHFYGPGDDESKFTTFIIHNILKDVKTIDLTEGAQKRDFIYIDDVANAFLKVIDHSLNLEKGYFSYEVGTAQNVSIREFVTLVKDLASNKKTFLNFNALPYRDNEVMESSVDATEIRKLAWKPEFSLEEGLKATISRERERL